MSRQRRWDVGRGEHLPRRFTRQVHERRRREVHVRGAHGRPRSQDTPHLLCGGEEERSGCADGSESQSAAAPGPDDVFDRRSREVGRVPPKRTGRGAAAPPRIYSGVRLIPGPRLTPDTADLRRKLPAETNADFRDLTLLRGEDFPERRATNLLLVLT